MTRPTLSYPAPTDTPATADLRAVAHQVGTAARVALLVFAADLALDTLPPGKERDRARSGLALASRVAAGQDVDPDMIAEALQDEDDEGPLYYQQVAPAGPQASAWSAVASAMGYAAWQESMRRGEQPAAAVDGFKSPDALDFCIDPLIGVPDLDWAALARAVEWVRENAGQANGGWGEPVRVDALRPDAHLDTGP